jgi:hypothetical protein
MSNNGPMQGYWYVSHGQKWAHSWQLTAFLMSNKWAHSRMSAVSFMSNNGPIQGYWQVSLGQKWAHSLAAFLMSDNGPIHGYRQFLS